MGPGFVPAVPLRERRGPQRRPDIPTAAVRLRHAGAPATLHLAGDVDRVCVGQEIDFENSRPGRGATVNLEAVIHPFDHLEISLLDNQQWLHVDDATGASRELFDASVSRARATYNFTARSFVRVIGQVRHHDARPVPVLVPRNARTTARSRAPRSLPTS